MLYHSTRSKNETVTSKQAIRMGIASDGGLFVTDTFPYRSLDLETLKHATYQELACTIMSLFFDDYNQEELTKAVTAAYGTQWSNPAITPVQQLSHMHLLQLFLGPTSAFKDVALQILPHLLSCTRTHSQEKIMIVTATSGDTGKAALEGFHNVEGVGVCVFYPYQKVSEVQRLQMEASQDARRSVFGIYGTFDDAQRGVKEIFAQGLPYTMKNVHLSSANSINIGRLIPQITYYVASYLQLCREGSLTLGEEVVFSVPTGNFGDVLAGWYAKQMGLPIKKFLVASNANHVLADFFQTGSYDLRNRSFVPTASPSMDILVSSNLERLLYSASGGDCELITYLMSELSEKGHYQLPQHLFEVISEDFEGYWADDQTCFDTIRHVWNEDHILIDPHTATAVHAVHKSDHAEPHIALATASPYKFSSQVLQALNESVPSSEFDAMRRLALYTHTPVPEALASLESMHIRGSQLCNPQDMHAAVVQALEGLS